MPWYRARLFAALAAATDERDAEQRLAVVGALAAGGDAEARRRLYATFAARAAADQPDGATRIVQLDGVAGLLHVAARLRLDADDRWYARYLTDLAAETAGTATVETALAEAAAGDAGVAAFLDAVRADRADDRLRDGTVQQPAADGVDHDRIQRGIVAGSPASPRRLDRWGGRADEAELVRAATDLLAEDDPRRLRAYLRLFGRRRFPLDPPRLVEYARHPDSRVAAAVNALVRLAHPAVRTLADGLLAAGVGRGPSCW